MAILEDEVEVTIGMRSIKHYTELGYIVPKQINNSGDLVIAKGTKMVVKVEDLTEGSNIKVTKICDICGKTTPNQLYQCVIKNRKKAIDNKDRCSECGKFLGIQICHNKRGYKHVPSKTKHITGNGVRNSKIRSDVCPDGISYPEKFLFNVLNQIGVKVKREKTFEWSKKASHDNPKLCGKKRYDFYIPFLNCIVETHGLQHYEGGFTQLNGVTTEDVQKNDEFKKELAIKNGISYYITIDCRKSELDFIKNNVLSSLLSELFDLDNINWEDAHKFACKTIIKTACDMWNEGYSAKEISRRLGLARTTVGRYLTQGNTVGWCNYDPDVIQIESGNRAAKKRKRKVVQLSPYLEFIKVWESISDVNKHLSINSGGISSCCKGKQKITGGYKWMYKEDYDKYIEQKIAWMNTKIQ